jgi:serine/threonine protein kinase
MEIGELYLFESKGSKTVKQPIPFGNYYLMDLIAKGGMAEVYKAKYLGPEGFSKLVALKRILPELAEEQDFIKMFIDEAKIASQLNHSNITQILQLGEAQGTYFIAMEFVQGKDLRTLYERSRRDDGYPITPQMAAFILAGVCDGIDFAHRKYGENGKHLGIIHRDVSPQNVLVSFDGDAKLIDFGIAKAQDKLVKTEAGILKGKYCYMSPEQVRGATIDHRSDIFGLGVVLHEVLTRQRLFLGSNDLKTLENVLTLPIPVPSSINPEIPPAMDAIVMRALSRDVSARYQYASDMREELMRFLYSSGQVFGRRELSGYMHHVFGADLEKEMRRQAAYEPFFEALPNTPLPSAVGHLSQSSTAETAAGAGLSVGQPPPMDSHDRPTQSLNADVTSYSGPHPAPSALHQSQHMPAHTAQPQQPPPANPTFQMSPPSSQPPAYLFQGDPLGDDDDDPTALQHDARKAVEHFKQQAQHVNPVFEDDLPTRQLDWPVSGPMPVELSPLPPTAMPQTALIPAQQYGVAPVDSYGYLKPPAGAESIPPTMPPTSDMHAMTPGAIPGLPMPGQSPLAMNVDDGTSTALSANLPASHHEFDDDESETSVQPTIQQASLSLARPKSSGSGKILVLVLAVVALFLTVGMGGVYIYRCPLLGVCGKTPPPPVIEGTYTLQFAKPMPNAQILINGKPFPAKQTKKLKGNRIKMTFDKPGKYDLEIRSPGCQPLKNRITIILNLDMETPKLSLSCK